MQDVTYFKNSLVQLHHGNWLAETRIFTVAKVRVYGIRHFFESIFWSVEPPLWSKDVGVWAPYSFGASNAVEALADFCAAGNEVSVDVVTFGGNRFESEAADGRPHAEAFADDCLQIWEGLCLCPGDRRADGGRGVANFLDEGVVRWRGGDDGEEGHSEGVGGRIRASDAILPYS